MGGNGGIGGEVAARRSFFESAFPSADVGASPDAGARPVPGHDGDVEDDDAL